MFTLKLALPPESTSTAEIELPAPLVKVTDTPAGKLRTALELNW
jgi:hypothetical protein